MFLEALEYFQIPVIFRVRYVYHFPLLSKVMS